MNNKTVLVTGSSRGIGRAIAYHLGKEGYNLVLHCHKQRDQLELLASELLAMGRSVRLLQFDVADRQLTEQMLLEDINQHGIYYAVICNAGIARDNPFPILSGDDWDQVIDTNLGGLYNILQPLVMPMIQARKPGRIVTLSSISGLNGNRGQVNYSAAKAGIIGATKSLALELAKRKITVNCVAPGLIETDMLENLPLDEIKRQIPARRLGKPEEVAALVSFLLSDAAAYITRQVISVNGGLL
ncbi:MAG TPA: 3-oxoacyl-ACP reductase FabG [Crenotrichaceae bacterium]|nr:3-oxoacyl-ACP reductase FabG [Crenotrichaceae bacterium]